MKRFLIGILVLSLVCVCGCGSQTASEPTTTTAATEDTAGEPVSAPAEVEKLPDYHFSKMVYERPDLESVKTSQANCMELARDGSWYELSDALGTYLAMYSQVQSAQTLAMIYYHLDTRNADRRSEYEYCTLGGSTLAADHEKLLRCLAQGRFAEMVEKNFFYSGFFDIYLQSEATTPQYEALLVEESELLLEFSRIYEDAPEDQEALIEILIQLVKVRRRIAAQWGYEDYAAYAYDRLYQREYTPEEAMEYIGEIRAHLAPLYCSMMEQEEREELPESTQEQTLAYLRKLATGDGGVIATAFQRMEDGALYDIRVDESKYNDSYCIYLRQYKVPFLFVNAQGTQMDQLTVAHEFGHFCRSFASRGSADTVVIAEFFSQGMEYLSLQNGSGQLKNVKLQDALTIYVTGAAISEFELGLYAMAEDELTPDKVRLLFTQIAQSYGVADLEQSGVVFNDGAFTQISHLYERPMYYIDYPVSNDAALQLLQLEQQTSGTGWTAYTQALTNSQPGFLGMLEAMGMTSPFSPGRIREVRDYFQEAL